jgi:D-glucuronyl C5-epimerase C-terminus
MRMVPKCACLAAAGCLMWAGWAGPAFAKRPTVLVLDRHGHVHVHRALSRQSEPAPHPAPRPAVVGHAARRGPTVVAELKRMLAQGTLTRENYDERRAVYDDARRTVRRLHGIRRIELADVLNDLAAMAAAHKLTATRVPALWATLAANRRWWSTGPLLGYGQRVGFSGSELVWQFYPGHGIQIQWLGTFGKLNGLWGSRSNRRAANLMLEALSLAARRAGGIAWEYLFDFDGSRAPWVSGLAQGTALQALARTAVRVKRTDLIPTITEGLGIFRRRPPTGIRVRTDGGAHYLEYSGLPHLRILNGFIQSLVGLHDFADLTGNAVARALELRGEAAARVEVPRFDTGAWSLYSRGSQTIESNLHYHVLLRDFLQHLCDRVDDAVFCGAAAHFTRYLSVPPVMRVRTVRLRAGRVGRLRFRLSKISYVTVRFVRRGRVVQAAGLGTLAYGNKRIWWRAPRRAGRYTLQVLATDLAGNNASVAKNVRVTRRG